MLGRCDRASISFVKNQRAEVYSVFPTWQRDGEQGRKRNTSIMTCPMSHAAPTMGSGCRGLVSARARRCKKLSIFLVRAREGGSVKYTMPMRL
jgi:hypothetical protein